MPNDDQTHQVESARGCVCASAVAAAAVAAEAACCVDTRCLYLIKPHVQTIALSRAMQSPHRPGSSGAMQASPDAAMYSPSVYVTVFDLDTRSKSR